MGIRRVPLQPGEFYHVYNRGTDKRLLFKDDVDRQRFLKLLYISNSLAPVSVRNILRKNEEPYSYEKGGVLVHIGAYCLMPNHFHLLLTPCVEDGVTLFMQKLGTGYSMYFNRRYNRTGTLFEGPFKSSWVDSDVYLKYLYAYIHLNPTKLWDREDTAEEPSAEDTLAFLKSYQYSSFPDYLQVARPESAIINPTPFPEYFATGADHLKEINQWLEYKDQEFRRGEASAK
jgi:putative transposase